MEDESMKLPDVHFGVVKERKPHRGPLTDIDLGPDDDELLPETPPEVIMMLGFDPREAEDELDDEPDL